MHEKKQLGKRINNVYQSLEPLYFITLVLGLSPYKYHREYKPSKVLVVYSVIIIVSFLCFYTVVVHWPRALTGPSIMTTLDAFHIYYNNMLSTVLVFLACKEHRRVIYSVKQLSSMDHNLTKLGFNVSLNHNSTRWRLTAYLMLLAVVTALLETANCSYTLRETVIYAKACWLYCYFSVLSSAMLECQFLTFMLLLQQRFAELNKYLQELTPKLQFRNVLKDIQTCHMELCNVLKCVNSAFGLQLLLCIGLIFLESTLNLVHVFQQVKNKEFDADLHTTVLWVLYFLARLFLIALLAQLTVNEANNTASLLHNIQVHPEDEETITTILAAAAMYLLIMVQMDNFPRDDDSNNNTTTL